jgi:PPOX class probable F420-dependent enzyme
MVSIPQSHRDLVTSSQVVSLATNGHDGYPQVTATWFLLDDGNVIRISVNTERHKLKNLRRDPRATLFFVDPANPNRTLEIRANVTIEADDDYAFADRVGARYGGVNLREFDGPGATRVTLLFEPVKVNTWGS